MKIYYIKLLHSFIRSIMIRLLMNYGKLILLKSDKKKIGNITTPHRRVTVSHFEGGLPLPEGVWRKDLCHTTRNRKRIKKQTCNTYYILNTTNRNELVNGLRDIKELLLQYHNVFNV